MSQAGRFVTAEDLGAVTTLTGNTGGPVPPTGGNINVVGDGTTIEIAGNPGTSTLTATFIGSTSVTLDGNVGSATGSTITVTTGASNAQGTALFTGSGSTLTMTFSSLDGNDNLGLGARSLESISTGAGNVAYGVGCLTSLKSSDNNICFGNSAGANITTGAGANTLIGGGDLLVTGAYNIALGLGAGGQWGLFTAGTESSNIAIGSGGVAGENNTLHIGKSTGTGSQELAAAYICGIQGVDLSTAEVVTMASDQLGSTTLTAGSGISITPGAGIVTIAATGGTSFTWNDVPGNSQTLVANNGYVADNAGLCTMTLPALAAFGTIIYIVGNGSGGWKIAQNAGQNIRLGSAGSTTVGVAGSLASTNQYDSIQLLCVVADTTWNAISIDGNITIV